MNFQIIVDPNSLSIRNSQLLHSISTFWLQNDWYDPITNVFKSEGLLEVLNELASMDIENSDWNDLLISTLSVVDNYKVGRKNKLKLSNISFLGDRKFRYILENQGASSLIVNFLKFYLEEEGLDTKVYLERLYFAKNVAGPLLEMGIHLEFSEGLEKREVFKATKAYPVPMTSGNGESTRYSMNYKLQLNSGEVHLVQNNDFAADRGYLSIGSRYILLDESIYQAISKQRKLTNLDKVEASAIFNNPTQALFPPGTDTEKFDMSEYDARVASFELAPKVQFREIVSSNIEWYKTEDGKIPCIHLRNDKGQPVAVEISPEIVNSLIAKMETSINSGIVLADGNPRPVDDGAGNMMTSSESNLNYLKSFREILHKTENEEKVSPAKETRSIKVAVLREVTLPESKEIFPRIILSKQEMSEFLNKDIQLDDHQVEGVNWLLNSFFKGNGGVFLCDDMGLGKTIQLILFFTILQNLEVQSKLAPFANKVSKEKPSIVIAPLILISNWDSEIKKFIKPKFLLSVYILHGSNLNSIKNNDGSLYKSWWKNYQLILTNYNTFARYQVDLLRYPYLVTFFDESQNIKNPDIAASRAARGLNSQFVVCATGTPVEIRLMDLWTQMDSLKRRPAHPLGVEQEFSQNYEKDPEGSNKIKNVIRMNDDDGIMLRRDKALLRTNGRLPDKVLHEPYFVPMTPLQETQEAFIVKTFQGNSLKILQNLQMLYQHPYLLSKVDLESDTETAIKDSPKLQKTLDIIDSIKAKNEKVLVFTLWTEMQGLLKRVFKDIYGFDVSVINGETNSKKRGTTKSPALDIIDQFSKKEGFNILILSPLAAGAGLNITAANHVIHYGRWWNPAKEDQSTDRAYRIGQKKTVHVHYPVLLASDGEGFDKKLDQRVRERRQMATDVLQPIHQLDSDDIFESNKGKEKL